LNARRNPAATLLLARARTAHWPVLALLFCAVLAGCRHKIPGYTIPIAPEISLDSVVPLSGEPSISTETPPDFGSLPQVNLPAAPQRRRYEPREEPASPAPAADAPAPADLAIGSLSTGLDATPQVQQQARDMISSIQKRIAALSPRTAEAQKRQVRQVRHFLDQAQQALSTGDIEGAKNLATKAGLLMDDLEKK
jgi:hypothetical protein